MRGTLYLTRVVVSDVPVASFYELDTSITAPPSAKKDQDIVHCETHSVLLRQGDCNKANCWYFSPCDGNSGCDVLLLFAPVRVYVACAVTLTGPRLHARTTAQLASSRLVGYYVMAESLVQSDEQQYKVVDVKLRKGYRGVALVSAGCQVQINHGDAHGRRVPDEALLPKPLGLGNAIDELCGLLQYAAQKRKGAVSVVVSGPHDCGVSLTVKYSLFRLRNDVQIVHWSVPFVAETLTSAHSTLALLLNPLEQFFPTAGDDDADDRGGESSALVLHKLRCDVAALAEKFSVALVATSHCDVPISDRLFDYRIRLGRPDIDTRCAILAATRGGSAAEWRDDALGMVGLSMRDAIRAAGDPVDGLVRRRPLDVKWDQIGGVGAVKEQLRSALVSPRRNPAIFRRFGLSPPTGVLLYGPPGCAKTTLVKALCSEGCFSLIYLDSASLLSSFVGESERQLRDVFRRASEQSPCVVFFDEVEVLGASRNLPSSSSSSSSSGNDTVRLLATLLTEMDGFSSRSDVCFIGATNVPQLLDPALLRPGRFDHLVYVPLPSTEDRLSILSTFLGDLQFDRAVIGKATEGFSGADLQAVCTMAVLNLPNLIRDNVPHSSLDGLDSNMDISSALLEQIKSFKKCDYDNSSILAFHARVSCS